VRIRIRVAAALLLSAQAWGAETVAHPYRGVTYVVRSETSPRHIVAHVVLLDLRSDGLRFKLTPPSGSRECVRQTTLEFLRQEHAQIAVNTHFFAPFPSPDTDAFLIGLAASDGNVYSAFESPSQSYALVKDAPAMNIGRDNRVTMVHRDPAFPDGMHVRENVMLWTVVSGSAQIVTGGVSTIPQYGVELTAGGPNKYSQEKSWYEQVNARTAIGITRDANTLVLFTVDVRGGSAGMKVGEVAEMLIRDYRVYDALNLDGGGSTTLAIGARVVNASSDSPGGRKVASSLAVFVASSPQ
jgi:exopolysaccharide biosynthesis protein